METKFNKAYITCMFMPQRGKGYYCKPIKVPEYISIKTIALALLAKKNIEKYLGGDSIGAAGYKEILDEFKLYVPHSRAYDILCSCMKSLRQMGRVARVERGKYVITPTGLRALKRIDETYGLPESLKEPIEDVLNDIKCKPRERFLLSEEATELANKLSKFTGKSLNQVVLEALRLYGGYLRVFR